MASFRLLAPALFALALCGTPLAASAQGFSDSQRGDIETIAGIICCPSRMLERGPWPN